MRASRSSIRTTLALVGCLTASVAHAQPSALAVTTLDPMRCAVVAFSTPVICSIQAHDVGGGTIEADLFVVAGGPATRVSASQTGSDVYVRLDVPEGEQVCTMRLQLRGIGAGTHTLHVIAPNAHVAAPMSHRPGADGEIARTTLTVR